MDDAKVTNRIDPDIALVGVANTVFHVLPALRVTKRRSLDFWPWETTLASRSPPGAGDARSPGSVLSH